MDTPSQSQLGNFELEQVPLLLVQGKQSCPGRGDGDGENGFPPPMVGWGGMSSHTLPHSRPNSSLSLPKVAQAGSLSPWKPLSIVKVQKIWKRRTVS